MNLRSEKIYVTRRVRNGFLVLAHLAGAAHDHDLTQATQTADELIDRVLNEYLDAQLGVTEKERAMQAAIKAVHKQFDK